MCLMFLRSTDFVDSKIINKMKNIKIKNYNPKTDYIEVENLYKNSETFGGQFDSSRDSKEKLEKLSNSNPEKIQIATINNKIVGTVTIFEDSRAGWLYRFAVQKEFEKEISDKLYKKSTQILKKLGHKQVLVYGPDDNLEIEKRYIELGLNKLEKYTCYWKEIK